MLDEILDALFFRPDFRKPGGTLKRMEKRLGPLSRLTVHCQHHGPAGSWIVMQAQFGDSGSAAVHTIVEKRGGTLEDGEFAWKWAHQAAKERGAECQLEEHFMAAKRDDNRLEEFERQLAELEKFTGRRITSLGLYPTDDSFILKAYLSALPGAASPGLSTIAAFDLSRQGELRAIASELAAKRHILVLES